MSPLKVGSSTVYRGKSGQWSFVAHRTTGFLVFFFLLLHIVDVAMVNIGNGSAYNTIHEVYGNIFLRIFECGLLFALLFHALNGIRIILVDFFPRMVRNEKVLSAWVVALTILAGVPGSIVIVKPWFTN